MMQPLRMFSLPPPSLAMALLWFQAAPLATAAEEKAGVEAEAEAEVQAELEAEAELQAEVHAELQAELQAEAEARVHAELQAQAAAEAEAEAASISAARGLLANYAARGRRGSGRSSFNSVAASPVRQHNRVVTGLLFSRVRMRSAIDELLASSCLLRMYHGVRVGQLRATRN